MTIRVLLMVGAVVCLGLSTFGVGGGKVNLMAAGLTLWALADTGLIH